MAVLAAPTPFGILFNMSGYTLAFPWTIVTPNGFLFAIQNDALVIAGYG